jgi:hypothetical protein
MSRAQRLRRQMRAVHPQRRVARGQLGSPDIIIPHRRRRAHQVGSLLHRDARTGLGAIGLLVLRQVGIVLWRAIVQRMAETLERRRRNKRDRRRWRQRGGRWRHLGPDAARDGRCTLPRSGRRGHAQPWQYQRHFAGLLAHRQGWLEAGLGEKKQETDLQRQRDQQGKRALAKRRNAGSPDGSQRHPHSPRCARRLGGTPGAINAWRGGLPMHILFSMAGLDPAVQRQPRLDGRLKAAHGENQVVYSVHFIRGKARLSALFTKR